MQTETVNSNEIQPKPSRGRPPRKLQDESKSYTSSGVEGQANIKIDEAETKSVGGYDYLIPYHGKDSLELSKPMFFVNGKKLIKIMKHIHGYAKDGSPIYRIKRKLFMSINTKRPESRRFIDILRKKGIPGV